MQTQRQLFYDGCAEAVGRKGEARATSMRFRLDAPLA
jgi:hypothetical protein